MHRDRPDAVRTRTAININPRRQTRLHLSGSNCIQRHNPALLVRQMHSLHDVQLTVDMELEHQQCPSNLRCFDWCTSTLLRACGVLERVQTEDETALCFGSTSLFRHQIYFIPKSSSLHCHVARLQIAPGTTLHIFVFVLVFRTPKNPGWRLATCIAPCCCKSLLSKPSIGLEIYA